MTTTLSDFEYWPLARGDESNQTPGRPQLLKEGQVLISVATVKLDRSRRLGAYNVDGIDVVPGDQVIVEVERGTSLGIIQSHVTRLWFKPKEVPPKLVRRFKDKEASLKDKLRQREEEQRAACDELAREKKLDLRVVDAEYLHWENRAVFYFTAEGRVDFRDLVRELSRNLRCRVEMRQIGPRDETRLLGGLGSCGREFCCSTFLSQFESIRIRMVKDQGLVLNPQKVSGGCGKLKCCLSFEVEVYRQLKKSMPKIGAVVITPDGKGTVNELALVAREVRVQLEQESGTKVYPLAQLCNDAGEPFVPEAHQAAVKAEQASREASRRPPRRILVKGDSARETPNESGGEQNQAPGGNKASGEQSRGRGQQRRPPRPRPESAADSSPGRTGEGEEDSRKPNKRRSRRRPQGNSSEGNQGQAPQEGSGGAPRPSGDRRPQRPRRPQPKEGGGGAGGGENQPRRNRRRPPRQSDSAGGPREGGGAPKPRTPTPES